MFRSQFAAVLGCAALFLTSTASFAAGQHVGHITPQQKQASDQAMQAGLGQLQAAASAIQGGGGAQAISDLQSAAQTMTTALPIYHGARERSIHAADRAEKELQRNTKKSIANASATIAKAIADCQAALQTN